MPYFTKVNSLVLGVFVVLMLFTLLVGCSDKQDDTAYENCKNSIELLIQQNNFANFKNKLSECSTLSPKFKKESNSFEDRIQSAQLESIRLQKKQKLDEDIELVFDESKNPSARFSAFNRVVRSDAYFYANNKETYDFLSKAAIEYERSNPTVASVLEPEEAKQPKFKEESPEEAAIRKKSWDEAQARIQKMIDSGEWENYEPVPAAKFDLKPPRIGMREFEVLGTTWGSPQSKNKTVTKDVISEQWVYGVGRYLYFRNGTLVAIQENN